MFSGPGRSTRGSLRFLLPALVLLLPLHLPAARASYYPHSGECKGKGKDCTVSPNQEPSSPRVIPTPKSPVLSPTLKSALSPSRLPERLNSQLFADPVKRL
ncbi:hypothetical protein KUCAC02_036717 [Chaenocephalus aceratus]|nr:hypothetical protein KUCAC02_036717 [Chaenocephalus aceratus]